VSFFQETDENLEHVYHQALETRFWTSSGGCLFSTFQSKDDFKAQFWNFSS